MGPISATGTARIPRPQESTRRMLSILLAIEPVLPHTSIVTAPSTQLEREIAKQDHRTKVKDLDKRRTEAEERYRTTLEKLAKDCDSQAFVNDPIMPGVLVMREPLN